MHTMRIMGMAIVLAVASHVERDRHGARPGRRAVVLRSRTTTCSGIGEAAARLATSKDWLSRNSHRLPFTVRLSDRFLRYNAKGIDRWIASRVGRGR